jgi:hypothetical protein
MACSTGGSVSVSCARSSTASTEPAAMEISLNLNWRTGGRCAQEIAMLKPSESEVGVIGPLSLPFVRITNGNGVTNSLMVHPFWRIHAQTRAVDPLRSAIGAFGSGRVCYVDTFDATRRPVNAWEKAISRQDNL